MGGVNASMGTMMNMTSGSGPSQTDMSQGLPPTDKRTTLQRPAKSAANKYRQMLQGNAIEEETDY